MREVDERYAAVARAAEWFADDGTPVDRARTRLCLLRWRDTIEKAKNRVLAWWFEGQVSGAEAARLLAEAIEIDIRACPPFTLARV